MTKHTLMQDVSVGRTHREDLTLYSVQPKFIFEELMDVGVFSAQPRLDPENWLHDFEPAAQAYAWLSEQMKQRLPAFGPSRTSIMENLSHQELHPVWAWFKWHGAARPKPDLRFSSMKEWGKRERSVLMTLKVPASEVLLHDYDGWHFCLNQAFFGTRRQYAAFEREFGRRVNDQTEKVERRNMALHKSWEAIFDLPTSRKYLGCTLKDQSVQATMWCFKKEYVVAAKAFGDNAKVESLI